MSCPVQTSEEVRIDTEQNQFWQVIKKCFGMLRTSQTSRGSPQSQGEDIQPETHAN